mmetsp:Transcript_21160/g.59520  ORF Transcript_21160/g.59520 Transcript_21160/m.59520 type:complete len:236 (-) Transcript_21160:564-1271(-)
MVQYSVPAAGVGIVFGPPWPRSEAFAWQWNGCSVLPGTFPRHATRWRLQHHSIFRSDQSLSQLDAPLLQSWMSKVVVVVDVTVVATQPICSCSQHQRLLVSSNSVLTPSGRACRDAKDVQSNGALVPHVVVAALGEVDVVAVVSVVVVVVIVMGVVVDVDGGGVATVVVGGVVGGVVGRVVAAHGDHAALAGCGVALRPAGSPGAAAVCRHVRRCLQHHVLFSADHSVWKPSQQL